MGKRGPAKQPTKLRLMRGDPSKVGKNRNEPRPPAGCEPPAFLNADALAVWHEIAPPLLAAGIITTADAIELGHFCETEVVYRNAMAEVLKLGPTHTNTRGESRPSGAFKAAMQARAQLSRDADKFGMTPSARAGMQIRPSDDSDPLGEFLKKQG